MLSTVNGIKTFVQRWIFTSHKTRCFVATLNFYMSLVFGIFVERFMRYLVLWDMWYFKNFDLGDWTSFFKITVDSSFLQKLVFESKKCEFENLYESLIKDIITCGTTDNILRRRLFCKSVLNLLNGIAASHGTEETCTQLLQLKKADNLNQVWK